MEAISHQPPPGKFEESPTPITPTALLTSAGFTGETVVIVDTPPEAMPAMEKLIEILKETGNFPITDPNALRPYENNYHSRHIRITFVDECPESLSGIIVHLCTNMSVFKMALTILKSTPVRRPINWHPGKRTGAPHIGWMSQWVLVQKRPIGIHERKTYYEDMT